MRRAVGIVRVSQAKGREGEAFASPAEQRAKIEEACRRDGLALLDVHEEIDVSGGTPLERREGLREAVERVESGDAEVVVVAYFDRLVRSLRVQGEVVSRVEAAGGRVLALDFGEVSEATAIQWLSGTVIGAMSEYYRRSIRERSGAAQALAVARGVAPWPTIPPGYVRGEDGRLVASEDAPAVEGAFRLRAEGAPIAEVRAFLAERGVERSYRGTQSLLRSRVVLGEIHFGRLVNLEAHEAIVSRELWQAVQRIAVSRGRRAKSERLLARLGVLRCAQCASRMVVASSHHGRYPVYRCPPAGGCPQRVTISAEMVEQLVVAAVLEAHADATGRASAEHRAREAGEAAERMQADLDAALRAFSGLEEEAAARERLAELRQARDQAVEEAAHLRGLSSALVLNLGRDWPQLSLDAKRKVVRAAVETVTVVPGRGEGRVSITLRQ